MNIYSKVTAMYTITPHGPPKIFTSARNAAFPLLFFSSHLQPKCPCYAKQRDVSLTNMPTI